MHQITRHAVTAALALAAILPSSAQAAGDLLVAPTRVVLDGARGTEVILNNIGSEPATYRISLELRRMTADGRLDEVRAAGADGRESAALGMIRFAPRLVKLTPNQPQAIRIGVQFPAEGVADGEYRAHLLFRAIPPATPVEAEQAQASGVAIQITPVYGVTIPVIVRKGNLSATAAIANPRIVQDGANPAFAFDLSRQGTRSVYGELRVTKAGSDEPLVAARGIAIYPEVASRQVVLPIDPATAEKLKGDVLVGLYEPAENGGALIAETRATIR